MAKQPASTPTVTVVNDDPDGCEIVARVVESGGYDVRRITDRAGAVTLLAAEPPAVAVLDLAASANHADSLALLERLRNSSQTAVRGMRLVAIAHHSSSGMFFWHAGTDAFLSRPFPAEELVSAVAEVIDRPDKERVAYREAAHRAAVEEHSPS